MDTATLRKILREELEAYTGKGLNDHAYLTVNEVEDVYAVVVFATVREKAVAGTVLLARLVGEQIVIDIDNHDKMLVDALTARGIPNDQIVLAYRGDPLPS